MRKADPFHPLLLVMSMSFGYVCYWWFIEPWLKQNGWLFY